MGIELDFQSIIFGACAVVLLIAFIVVLVRISWKGILVALLLGTIATAILYFVMRGLQGNLSIETLQIDAMENGDLKIALALITICLLAKPIFILIGFGVAALVMYFGGSFFLSLILGIIRDYPNLSAIALLFIVIVLSLAMMGNAKRFAKA